MPAFKVRFSVLVLLLGLTLPGWPLYAQPAPVEKDSSQTVVNSAMNAEMFYMLLLAELDLRSGQIGAGHSLLLEAARRSNDSRLYQRAIESSSSAEAALQSARAWRQAQPSTRAATRTVLQLLVAMNRINDTLEPLKAELAQSTALDLPLTIASIPRYYQPARDKKQAASVVEQALTDYTVAGVAPATAIAAWNSIGRMRLAAADQAGALEAAQNAMTLDASATGSALLALELMNSKVANAESLVRRYMAGSPLPEIRMAYARVLLDQRRYGEALGQLQLLTQEKPDFVDAWLVLGVLQLQEAQAQAAQASLLKFIELAGSAPAADAESAQAEERQRALTQAYLALAQIAEGRKDLTAAQAWLDKIEDAQTMVSVQSRRASILARQGKLAEARQLLHKLPEASTDEARLKLLAEVNLLRDNKEYQEAYILLDQAQARFPDDPDLQYEQAMLAEKLGKTDEMESLLQKVIASKPDYHHAYNALGFSMAERNVRLPEAKRLIRKALDAAPDDPFIQDSMGWVEFRLGNKSEAIRILEAAYHSRPDVEIAAHLGEVLWSAGQHSRALLIWREGYKLDGSNETLLETLKRLHVKL